MKAMILAAGRGERMRPLTDMVPKPLLEVGGLSLIEHHLTALAEARFDEVVINHAHLGHMIEEKLGNGDKYGVAISYSRETTGGLETAGGIINAMPLLGEEPFLVVNGDVFTDIDFGLLRDLSLQDKLAHLVLVPNPEHNPEGDFSLEAGLVGMSEGQKHTFAGVGIYHPELFSGQPKGKSPLAPLLKKAIAERRVSGQLHTGSWTDVGTPQRLAELQQRHGR
ncbi:N-acetylmuramate alpha-1-phosphate uridylyltransferase MurU [Corallincola platygyrae]|uniref:N-acetylmuramate alpha-1-phosphate uridylyltransferase MurU n=1 Tax=Corallincola platygyrae TaxID=1193278 RepID=A0ABW4XL51_9GAMM